VLAIVGHFAADDEAAILAFNNSPIELLVATNTHHQSQHVLVKESKKIVVEDVTEIFANTIDSLLIRS
jgi:phosphoribosylpyrophosphate synthetase